MVAFFFAHRHTNDPQGRSKGQTHCRLKEVMLHIKLKGIKGLVGPVLVHNLDHAFTRCVQKDFVSVMLGVMGVIHYI